MRLAAAVALHAGGPGSGCRGPNCGRKSTGRTVEVISKRREIGKARDEWYSRHGHGSTNDFNDINPFGSSQWASHVVVVRDKVGNPVAAATIDVSKGDGLTIPENYKMASISEIRSHAPGAGRELIEHLKTQFDVLEYEATTNAAEKMGEALGFARYGESGSGTVYNWMSDKVPESVKSAYKQYWEEG